MARTWMSWSTGKDSALALYDLQKEGRTQVEALVTTVTSEHDRVSMHSTRTELLELQAEALGLELKTVEIPKDCTNEIYESAFLKAMNQAKSHGVDDFAYGDLFLEDIRDYRQRLHQQVGLGSIYPLWGKSTTGLAQRLIELGFQAYITCVDPRQLDPSFAGRKYDDDFLRDLPDSVDPCGENGEFHSFVFDGPNFSGPIHCRVGETVERQGFVFSDILSIGPANSDSSCQSVGCRFDEITKS